MIVALRCSSDTFGHVKDGSGQIRVRCRGKHCRHTDGTATYHEFDLSDGTFTTEHVPFRPANELFAALDEAQRLQPASVR